MVPVPPLASSQTLESRPSNSNSLEVVPVQDLYRADPEQGPSHRALDISSQDSWDLSETASSVDSVFDHNSRHDQYRFKLSDLEIRSKIAKIESGFIQVTLRKCHYSMGFEEVLLDQSRESLHTSFGDDGFSNKYESPALQQAAFEDYYLTDEVHEDRIQSAIGTVSGTEASQSIERLFGYHHQPHIEEEIRCEPGASGVTVRFDARHDVSETWSEEVQDQFERSLDMDTSDHYIGENGGEPSEQDIDNKCINCEEVNPHKRGSDGAFDN